MYKTKKKTTPDEGIIRISSIEDIQFWAKKFKVTQRRLLQAVELAGRNVIQVRNYLTGMHS